MEQEPREKETVSEQQPTEDRYTKRMSVKLWLVRLIQGAIIGGGAILPGVSGGVLCVSFGIYQPMMQFLAHPFRTFRKYVRLFIPIGVGWLLGFLFFAKVLTLLFHFSDNVGVSLFIGLIAGTFPSLWREAGKHGRTRGSWVGLGVSFTLMLALFLVLDGLTGVKVTPNIGWYFFCGLLWGLSVVIPGLTSSSLIIFLGLYEPLLSAANAIDLRVILPMLAGIIAVLLVASRAVNRFFEKHYSVAFFCVLGFVFSTTVVIIPTAFASWWEGLLCAALAVGGFFGAWAMERYGNRLEQREQSLTKTVEGEENVQ